MNRLIWLSEAQTRRAIMVRRDRLDIVRQFDASTTRSSKLIEVCCIQTHYDRLAQIFLCARTMTHIFRMNMKSGWCGKHTECLNDS